MKNKPLDIADFLKMVVEALNAAGVEYLIGGAIAEWAWGDDLPPMIEPLRQLVLLMQTAAQAQPGLGDDTPGHCAV